MNPALPRKGRRLAGALVGAMRLLSLFGNWREEISNGSC